MKLLQPTAIKKLIITSLRLLMALQSHPLSDKFINPLADLVRLCVPGDG